MTIMRVPEESAIAYLFTSEEFVMRVIKFLLALPYTAHTHNIIEIVCRWFDPSPGFIKNLIQELVPSLENDTPCLSSLNLCLATLKV